MKEEKKREEYYKGKEVKGEDGKEEGVLQGRRGKRREVNKYSNYFRCHFAAQIVWKSFNEADF